MMRALRKFGFSFYWLFKPFLNTEVFSSFDLEGRK